MNTYTVLTTDREFTLEARSEEHAHAIVMGHAWPVGIPPAPRPAEHADGTPTAEWQAWWTEARPRLWGERIYWPAGECLLRISEAA